MLLKTILTLRAFQAPAALIFLIAASWVAYLVNHSSTPPASHLITTTLRFLTPLLTLAYTLYEIYSCFMVIRGRDIAGKFELRLKSRGFKLGRIVLEFAIGGLWFVSFIFSLGVGGWSMTGENTTLAKSTYNSSNGTVSVNPSGNATVIPAQVQDTLVVVPEGGKPPMILGSAMWIVLIGLFSITSLLVIVQTARNWSPPKQATAEIYGQEMGRMEQKREAV